MLTLSRQLIGKINLKVVVFISLVQNTFNMETGQPLPATSQLLTKNIPVVYIPVAIVTLTDDTDQMGLWPRVTSSPQTTLNIT